jgi:putative flippase GtrA
MHVVRLADFYPLVEVLQSEPLDSPMPHILSLIRSEARKLLMFATVGFSSLMLIIGLYTLFSRVIWVSGPRTLEYAIVVSFVAWVNYEANRHFTFQSYQRSFGSMGRFTSIAVIAASINSILFWVGTEIFYFQDFFVIIADAAFVGIFTFSSHRLFTFHERPWRWIQRASRSEKEEAA